MIANLIVIKKSYPTIKDVLSVKSRQWAHEKEVRFLRRSAENCFLEVRIKKVYLGVRATPITKAIIYGIKSAVNFQFEIVDLASVGVAGDGVNYWNNYDNKPFEVDNTLNKI